MNSINIVLVDDSLRNNNTIIYTAKRVLLFTSELWSAFGAHNIYLSRNRIRNLKKMGSGRNKMITIEDEDDSTMIILIKWLSIMKAKNNKWTSEKLKS